MADLDLDDLPAFPTAVQVAKFLQVSEASLAQDRYLGRGIPYIKVGLRRVRYSREDVLKYLATNTFRGGGDAAA